MPDPVLDPSTPCCKDFSRLQKKPAICAVSPKLGSGATGGLSNAATGTWTNTLNATGGGAGGGTGTAWYQPDPAIAEGWT